MKQINYILVNETNNQLAADAVHNSTVSAIRYGSTIIDAVPGFKVQGSRERAKLLDELCRLRKQWPDAKILGLSELDTSASHAPVHVSDAMNAIRREMSDLP